MITRSIKCLLTATLLLAACALSSTALAEDLTLYSNVVKHVDAHNAANEIRLSEKGKVVGKCYSISTTVKVNSKAGTGTRVALGVVQLPKGTFWTETTATDMPHKAVPGLGHKHSGIILGGTRDYEGVTGSYDLELSKDGKYTVSVCHIVRDKK
ncbi:MAG: hypothetical protein EBS96_03445 [Spartobacteria bacterium]|nr:hypothetical protein [Spartobacteria bacterium]